MLRLKKHDDYMPGNLGRCEGTRWHICG